MSVIAPHVLAKGKAEVREDESRKKQSLKQLKEWFNKHPWIQRFNTDDEFLLIYLRSRKYQMDRVYESIEKGLIFAAVHPEWVNFHGEQLQRAMDLYNDGCLKVLKQRDSEGRRIILMNNNVNMDKYNADDVLRLHIILFSLLAKEEDTQYCGIIYIDDFTNAFSMKYLMMYPVNQIFDFAQQLKSAPVRIKKIAVIGFPSIAANIFSMVKFALTDVLKERIQLYNDRAEMLEHFDRKIITTDAGGEADEQESIDCFRVEINDKLSRLRDFYDSDIDLNMALASKKNIHEDVGSFRKLEID